MEYVVDWVDRMGVGHSCEVDHMQIATLDQLIRRIGLGTLVQRAAAVATAILLVVPVALAAQRPVELKEAPPSKMRTIGLSKLASIRSADLDTLLAGDEYPKSGAIGRDGTLFLVFAGSKQVDRVFVFSANGAFVRSIGRSGNGPGEFRIIRGIARGLGDSMYVQDATRMAVITAEKYQRSFPFTTWGYDFAFLGNGSIIMQTGPNAEYWAFKGDGTKLSIGEHRNKQADDFLDQRWVTAAGEDIWIAHRTKYQVDRRDSRGESVESFSRKVDWFRTWTKGETPAETKLAELGDIRVGPDGLVWLFMGVPTDKWVPASKRTEHYTAYTEQLIEVFDPKTGTIVARRKSSDIVRPLTGLLAVKTTQDKDGFAVNDLFRLEIK